MSQREHKAPVRLLLIGIAIAVIVYVATGGHVLFLPLLLILPFGLFAGRKRDRGSRWSWRR